MIITTMRDPLKVLYEENIPDFSLVNKVVAGNLYIAMQLSCGHIGVCATLGNRLEAGIQSLERIDFSNISHRMLLISYYNALFSKEQESLPEADIFDSLNFRSQGPVVMVGYFRPLVRKFDQAEIPVEVFDLKQDDTRLRPYKDIGNSLKKAMVIILTSTSLVNNTFAEILDHAGKDAGVYMLGPTTILHQTMFRYPAIKGLFGMKIPQNETRVLNIISAGGGTPEFSPFTTKVAFFPPIA